MYVYIILCVDSLACRAIIELLEDKLSRRKQKEHSLSRRDSWQDILGSDSGLLNALVLLIERGDAKLAKAAIERKDGEGLVIYCIQGIYKKTSRKIHEEEYDRVPIKLGQLTDVEAVVMMELCRRYPVDYDLYRVDGKRIESPGTPLDFIKRGREGVDDNDDDDLDYVSATGELPDFDFENAAGMPTNATEEERKQLLRILRLNSAASALGLPPPDSWYRRIIDIAAQQRKRSGAHRPSPSKDDDI